MHGLTSIQIPSLSQPAVTLLGEFLLRHLFISNEIFWQQTTINRQDGYDFGNHRSKCTENLAKYFTNIEKPQMHFKNFETL
jgi:hypothetical protein